MSALRITLIQFLFYAMIFLALEVTGLVHARFGLNAGNAVFLTVMPILAFSNFIFWIVVIARRKKVKDHE